MYTLLTRGGLTYKVQYFDGGGAFLGGDYEVHGLLEDGEPLCIYQKDIKEVKDSKGEHFIEFGNQYYSGHPYEKEFTNQGRLNE